MTSLAQESADHLIILPFEAWGHVRALCVLTARLVQARPLTITFFTTVDMYDRIDAELNRNFPDDKSSLKASYIRLVAIRSEGQNPLDMQVFVAAFPEAYRALVDEKPITCIKTGKILPGVPAPNAAILDMFLLPLLTHIQTLSRKPVKTFCWTPCAAYAAGGLVHVILQGPDGGLLKMIESISAQTGKPLEDVATEILDGARGIVGKVPGLPPMYDYEKEPQKMIIDMSVGGAFQLNATKFLQECDGVITSSPACYEPAEALSAFSDWLAQTSRKLYCVGPLLPLDTPIHAAEVEKALSADAATIDAFLNSMLQSHGAKSVIFMSFGSFFWSTEPEKIWAFLDVLLEKNVPFILSHGSPFAVVPDEISAKFNTNGLGLLTRWAPQQVVLTHPAIGWFVTHAGFNSVIESIVAGVPMICWPFQAEQPMNAAHLTTNLDVAYELIEVRTGERGLQPIHRLGRAPVGTVQAVREEAALVVDKAFGEDGENKRANILKLREQVLAAWEAGGSGHRDLESLRDAICAT